MSCRVVIGKRAYNPDYLDLCTHYDLSPLTINVGCPNEQGDVESANRHLKRRLDQHLLLRGSRDFASVVLFFAAILLLSRHQRPPALWMITMALLFNMAGDLLYALMDAGHLGTSTEHLALTAYVAAYFSATSGFLHPSIRELGRPQPNPPPHREHQHRVAPVV